MTEDFKLKRINYMNKWPNVELFDIEKEYCFKVNKIKKDKGTIFIPFELIPNDDKIYNITISFIIEALDQIEKYPNYSYEFIFKAYNCFVNEYYGKENKYNLTDINKNLCDHVWNEKIESNEKLNNAFKKLFSVIPVSACQYIYKRLTPIKSENKVYKRVTSDMKRSETSKSEDRKKIIDLIAQEYGMDFDKYEETIRKASILYRRIFKYKSVTLDDRSYKISLNDKLHILVSGFLYTLRNDKMHGGSMSITKSSKTKLRNFALDYYAFLLLYFLLVVLIIEVFPVSNENDPYTKLAEKINTNIELYKCLFKRNIDR